MIPPTLDDFVVFEDQVDQNGNAAVNISVNCEDFYCIRSFIQRPGKETIYSDKRSFSGKSGGSWYYIGNISTEIEQIVPSISLSNPSWSFSTTTHGYVIGLSKDFMTNIMFRFDPEIEQWEQLESNLSTTFNGVQVLASSTSDEIKYMFGPGFIDVLWMYNIVTNQWQLSGELSDGVFQPNSYSFEFQETLFIGTGGFAGDYSKLSFKISDLESIPIPDFPGSPRQNTCYFIIDNKGYVGAGEDSNQKFADFWALDFPTSSWSKVADLPEAISSGVGFSSDGKGYLLTGSDEDNVPHPGFWEYNSELDNWTRLSDFGRGDGNAAIGFAIDGVIYGGLGFATNGESRDEFWRYVPELD